jgi:16S rRNA (uracil1498-N3)-methyltransferase
VAAVTEPVFHLAPIPDGATFQLTGPEGRHAAKVRRIRPGELIDVTDGRGTTARCEVLTVAAESLELAVRDRVTLAAPTPRIVVVQALAKGDRGELAVEMLTEIGVDEIVPWAAARCVVRWEGARGERALERWRSTAREAAKQARRSWWPVVTDLATTAEVAGRLATSSCPVVLHEESTAPLGRLAVSGDEVVIVVGPEGGISAQELAALAVPTYRLGDTVLRTSTAGVAAASVLLTAAGRW